MQSIPYGLHFKLHGCVHSIDKLILIYFLREPFSKVFDHCLSLLESSGFHFCDDRSSKDYNGYRNSKPSPGFYWYNSSFWSDSFRLFAGSYHRGIDHPSWDVQNIIKVEFNPNKTLFFHPEYQPVFDYLRLVSSYDHNLGLPSIFVSELDYAVDVPCKTSQIVCRSLKDKVTYQDSRYYGKRHNHGRLKIYNKKSELMAKDHISLASDLTRCEITIKDKGILDFSVLTFNSVLYSDSSILSSNLKSIVNLIDLLMEYGEDAQDLMSRFVPDKRNRDKILPFLVGDVSFQVFDLITFFHLLELYKERFGFSYLFYSSFGTPLGSGRPLISLDGGD